MTERQKDSKGNWKFAITSKNDAFVAKIFMAIFALTEMLPTSAILVTKDVFG